MKKSIIIFGALGALGRGVASALLRKKSYDTYYLFDFNAEKEITTDKRVILFNTGDLSSEDNVRSAFGRIRTEKDQIFYLFSTVGGFMGGVEVQNMAVEDFDRMFNINMKSNFLISKYFIKIAEQAGGAICFTSALSAFNPEAGRTAYGASKSALNYLVNSLAEECYSKKISVTGIAPFILDTPANREWMNKEEIESSQKPEEIGELIDFIFSNYHYLSGNIISLKKRFRR